MQNSCWCDYGSDPRMSKHAEYCELANEAEKQFIAAFSTMVRELFDEVKRLNEEHKLYRERLGPAGMKMITDVYDENKVLKTQLEAQKKALNTLIEASDYATSFTLATMNEAHFSTKDFDITCTETFQNIKHQLRMSKNEAKKILKEAGLG